MYTLPELPYAVNALEPYIDEQTMNIHHGKHHATYIKNLNDALIGQDTLNAMSVEDLIKNITLVPEPIRTKVRNNAGGHANHSLFWKCMTSVSLGGGVAPTGPVAHAIDAAFGSFGSFQEKFLAVAVARFGSGWVWLVHDHGSLAIMDTPNQDSPLLEEKYPLLALDVWEHAYYLKYQNLRAEYIKNWWNIVNWKHVETLFAPFSG